MIDENSVLEVARRRWIDENSILEVPRTRWIDENSVLEVARTRWIDENSILEVPRRRWIDENSVLEDLGTRWIDDYSTFGPRGPCPGGPGVIKIVLLASPPRVTSPNNVASNGYPDPPQRPHFLMILNSSE